MNMIGCIINENDTKIEIEKFSINERNNTFDKLVAMYYISFSVHFQVIKGENKY